jgi:urease accessory protein
MQLSNLKLPLQQRPSSEGLLSGLVRIETLSDSDIAGLEQIVVPMTAEERRKVRRRLVLPDGVEIGLALFTGSMLTPGTVLYKTATKAYVVEAALEQVLAIKPRSLTETAKIAHFMGNLHRDIDIQYENIVVLYEPALEIRLQKLGYEIARDQRPFMGRPTGSDAHNL